MKSTQSRTRQQCASFQARDFKIRR